LKYTNSLDTKGSLSHRRLLATTATVLAAVQVSAQAQPAAQNIAKPIDRQDFNNRIWKTSGTSRGPLVSTQVLKSSEEIHGHTSSCEHQDPCRQNVFVAGTGYLNGHNGPKNSAQMESAPQNLVHIAVLSAFIPAEGLTNAYLAVFDLKSAFPTCQIPIKVPPYHYGSWRLSGIFPVTQEKQVAWLEAGGGDGGWSWSLNVFVTFGTNCVIGSSQAYYVSAGAQPDTCSTKLPALNSFITVLSNGTVRIKTPPRNCMNVKITRDGKTIVGE
jgi:hypothetical protein